MLKVSGHRDRRRAQHFQSGDKICGLWPPANHQCRTLVDASAGRSLGFSLSMFVSDICNQTSNISDYGVEV